MKSSKFLRLRSMQGVTLIEMLVAIVIGLIVVLAATNVLVIGESHKRSTNSNNDTNQSGAFAAYSIDRALRSAGSGFAQAWDQGIFGCALTVARGGATILPRGSALPAPFAGFLGGSGAIPIAPVLIGQSQSAGGSDVLMVMGGNGSVGDVIRPIRSITGGDTLRLDSTVAIRNGDLGLVTQAGQTTCLLEQVSGAQTTLETTGNEQLQLGSTYYTAGGGSLSSMAASTTANFSVLGSVNANDVQFQLFGVDANRTLVSYDLLRLSGGGTDAESQQPMADGAVEMRALYGIDTSSPHDNIVDSWVAPTGAWSIDNIKNDAVKQRQIIAIRLAVVMRSTNFEKSDDPANDVTKVRPALFVNQIPGSAPINLSGAPYDAIPYATGSDERHFRLRVIETVVPLRNMLLLPAS